MRIKGKGYNGKGMMSEVIKKKYFFFNDNHKRMITKRLRYWRNANRARSAFSRIIERKAFLSSMY